jgi:hypothetical protein
MSSQTRVGKWSFEIEKKAGGDGAVKALGQQLLSLLH